MHELLAVFGIWKLSVMLSEFDGPLNVIKVPREWIDSKQTNWRFLAFDCYFCFSTVIAIPFAVYFSTDLNTFVLYWLGLSGGAWLLYNVNERLDV